ncbi:MAG: leucine-rich repeat protein, partial [Kiritimatiellae bacterium]|nr:leucine-rich repeat protein [Kiritimatiellia bacterium]
KDVTYYARWSALPTYTVTFDANCGKCATKTRQLAPGEGVGELPEATRAGWDFVGWFTAQTGGAQVTEATAVTKYITYYARWTEHYELVIDENGVLTGLTGTTPATIDVPATVTGFAANLFNGVAKITAATGGANVTACGAGAFRDSGIWKNAPNWPVVVCGVLVGWKGTVPATAEVPAGVRVIADGALAGAANLATLYLPDSLVAIGDGAFRDCAKLDDVFGLEDGVTVADNAFEGTLHATFRLTWSGTVVTGFKGPCPAEIVIPDNATGIGVAAFKDQTAITAVTIGTNVTIIGANAFKGCTGLGTVAINCDPPVLTTIGASAFEGCAALAAIDLPASVATIGASAFKDCTAITAIHLPASLTTIGESVFAGCTSLAAITGGEGVEVIRTSAFAGTPWYDAAPAGAFEEVMLGHVLVRMKGDVPASYEISTNVWMVANNAFAGVATLSDLYIGTEVVSLWDRAFAGCTSLGSVTVPSGCRELGDYLFEGCTSLTNVFFRGHAPTNDVPHVFAGTPETLKVRVKEGSRGWIEPGSDSDLVPARWPYKTADGTLVPNDLNRAIYDPEEVPGVVRSVIVDGTITNDTTWTGGQVYEVQQGCTVEGNATLTIEAGAIVKLPLVGRYSGNQFRSHGKLVVNGTRANPVVFTSIRDDSWGGDTNGDGDRSEPYPGECCGVFLYGQNACIEATYAKFLYGHAKNNFNAHACLMAHYVGSPSTLYGCEFSHAAMDGCFITAATLENCLFTDCDRGLVSVNNDASFSYMDGFYDRKVSAVNCVAYGNRAGFWSHTSSLYITNCIAAFNSEYGLTGDGGAVYSTRSCLWNPDGGNTRYQNYRSWIYNVDNIEADPLFLDAENGDFRISVESPCVDAALGEVAPELDFWGQPRMDVKYVRNTGTPNAAGEYPDIGLYEVPGTTERPVMNLEVESVSFAPASAAPGETLTVTYTVRNTGNTAAKGSIRDVVRIKSAANGGTMVAGTVTQNYNLQAAETAALHATVTMPAAPAGEWLVGIDVNPNRDVFEQNFLKNSLWTEDAVEVRLQEMAAGSVWSANVPAGTTMGYVLADVSAEGGVVVITESGGHGVTALPVVARVAAGHMPTAVMNDATSFVRADGAVVIVVPPHAAGDPVYLALENTGITAETVNVSVQALTTELWSVYPEIAANVGDMGFTFTGAGLNADSEFYLGGIKAKSVSVIDSANVYAVFDVQNIAADRYYDVSADGKTIRDAVYINKKAKGPI